MTFNQEQFAPVSAHSTDTPNIYSYKTTDTLAEVSADGYFDDKIFQFNVGDIIFVELDTGEQTTLRVSSVSPVVTVGASRAITVDDDGNWFISGQPGSAPTTIILGDFAGGNYTEVEEDGTLEFFGDATVFKSAVLNAASLISPVGKAPTATEFIAQGGVATGIAANGFAVGDAISGAIELPTDYRENTAVIFYADWQGVLAPTGTDNVNFQLSYTIGSETDDDIDVVTVITAERGINLQYGHLRTQFAPVVDSRFKVTAQFLFTLERIAASANEYLGDAILSSVGIHYEVDTIGARTAFTKGGGGGGE